MPRLYKRLKRILAITLVVFIGVSCVGLSLSAKAKSKSSKDAAYAEGDNVAFGRIDNNLISWTILSYDDSTKTAFIVASKGINSITITNYRRAIDSMYRSSGSKAGYVRWAENYWRSWCNEYFYNNCFTEDEKARIQQTTLTANAAQNSLMNFYHDTTLDAYYVANKTKNSMYMDVYNNQTTTTDYIFFLSSDEYTEHKDKIKAQTLTTWPLRTNAYDDPNQTLFVNDSTKLIERGYYYGGDAIRPAMYVNLGGLVEEDTSTTTDTTTTSSTTTSSSTNTSTSTTTDTSSTSSASTTTTDTSSTTDSSSTSSTTSSSSSQKAVTQKSYANNATNIGNINLPDDSSYSMKSGSTAQVAIDMNYLNSTDKQYTVTYKSSNANVFTVDSNGKITSTGTGTASLTVRMKKSNGKIYTMTCRIDVT